MKKIQLSIPEPCHQNWDDMTPTQQGRFCNACAKQVIDFSTMSDTEVLNYFNLLKKNENVCGRVWPDQLDRTIAALPQRKSYWYLNYFTALVFFFGKASNANAQTRKGLTIPKPVGEVNSPPLKKVASQKMIINDFVADEQGQPIAFASIKLLNSQVGVIADVQGRFTLKIDKLNCSIEVSALGYETKQVEIYNVSEREIVLVRSNKLLEEVVVLVPYTGESRRMGKMANRCSGTTAGAIITGTTVRISVKDTISRWISNFNSSIKIYPNPVSKGSTFKVALQLKQPGKHTLQITDATGRLVLTQQINDMAKEYNEQLLSSNGWSSGVYYLKVLDEKGKNAGTGSFIVQ